MPEQIYLAVDLGAESGRVMAGLWDVRALRLEEIHRFPNEPVEIADTLRWNTTRLWFEIQNGLTLAARRFGAAIKSVGVDTWGVDYVLLSKNSEVLGLPYHYRDRRTLGAVKAACERVPRAEIFAETGLQFMDINTLYQLIALKRSAPEILDTADCFLMMPDFFHWCLSGERTSEFTVATTSQCFHPRSRTWSRGLLEKFDLPAKIFLETIPPGSHLGKLRPGVMTKTGLGALDVIAPPTHDTAAAIAAVPTQNTGRLNWAYLSSGTWSLMGMEVPEAILTPRVQELNFTNEGGVDNTYRLLKNIMGLWLVQQLRRSFQKRGTELDYAGLVELASTEAPLVSLINPNDARFLNPADMSDAIQSFCRETGQPVPATPGTLVRCALESLALEYQRVLTGLEEVTGGKVETIHIVGGGSRNRLLNQFAANACNRQVLAGPVEATALGNLLTQVRAAGELGSLKDLRAVVCESAELQSFQPESSQAGAWRAAQARFEKLPR